LDITQSIESRRSIRKFKPVKVPRSIIRAALDLARWAPSAHNAQPWRIVVIDDDEVKKRLATEMGKAWLSDMLKDGVPREKAEDLVKLKSWDRITKSPVVVITCLTMEEMHKYPDVRRRMAEYAMAIQSVAAYIQTLLLIVHHYQLGACWICAPLFCKDAVRKALGLPRKFEPQAMIIIGYTEEEPPRPTRKPLDELCAFDSWPKQ